MFLNEAVAEGREEGGVLGTVKHCLPEHLPFSIKL